MIPLSRINFLALFIDHGSHDHLHNRNIVVDGFWRQALFRHLRNDGLQDRIVDFGQGQISNTWVKPVFKTGFPEFQGRSCNRLALPTSDVVEPPSCLFMERNTVFLPYDLIEILHGVSSAFRDNFTSAALPDGLGQATEA